MDYFIYNRKSQEDEGRQVQSIEDQEKNNLTLAQSLGATIKDNFKEAKSAKRPGRPIFNDMLDRIEAGEAQGIIAWHPDRLSRNAVDAGRIIDLIDRGLLRDLKFHTHTFENTPEGKWVLGIVLGQAKYQNDKLSIDVTRGIRSKVDKGQAPRRAIAGYINNKADHTYEEDPERFDRVQRAVHLVLHRTHNPKQALTILNEEWGFTTYRTEKSGGGPLSINSWYSLLSNPVIAGQFMHNGTLCQGKHPAMVSQLEYDQLQSILHKGTTRPQRHYFAFNGFIRCGVCGCQVLGERKVKHYKTTGTSKEYVYYHCSGRRGCPRLGVSPEHIEQQILGLLSQVSIRPKVAEWCLSPTQEYHRQESGFHQQTYEALLQTLAGVRRKKNNLLDLRLSDPDAMTPEEFKEENARLQHEINDLQKEIQRTQESFKHLEETVLNVFDFAVNAENAFREGDAEMRRRIAQLLGVKYVLTLEKLEIEPHPLLVPILTFEPSKIGSDKGKEDSSYDDFSSWLALRENIRTLVTQSKLCFPRLEWTCRETV